MVDMNDEIAGGEARHFGYEILRPACGASRPHQAIAQNVLLADHRRRGGFEPAFDPEHRERDLLRRQRERLRPRLNRREVGKRDRKSTSLNSSHVKISYAVFCLKKKR